VTGAGGAASNLGSEERSSQRDDQNKTSTFNTLMSMSNPHHAAGAFPSNLNNTSSLVGLTSGENSMSQTQTLNQIKQSTAGLSQILKQSLNSTH
jgi:hypothetical protein